MWIISKFLSAIWGLLGLVALVALFLIYANFNEPANLDFLNLEQGLVFDRQRFFYTFGGLFLLVNLMVFLTIRTTETLRKAAVMIHQTQQLKIGVALKVMACGANIFILVVMIYLKSAIENADVQSFWFLPGLLFGPLLIVCGLIYLLFVMWYPAGNR